MRTIIVDDEPWMLKRFAVECEGLPDLQLLGSFRSPLKALEFVRENRIDLAFIDMEMPELNGLELAAELRGLLPELIVIFVSAYEEYIAEAFKSKTADYYIMKPYSTQDLEAAIDRARLLSGRLRKQVSVRTFGSFELFVENAPFPFPDGKCKELFALLVDGQGGVLSAERAAQALWPQVEPAEEAVIRYRRLFRRLQEAMQAAHLPGIIEQNEQGAFLHTDILDCDLFQYLDGDPKAMRQFSGAYMTSYAWAESGRQNLLRQNELLERYSDAQIRNTLCASIRILSDERLTLTYMNEGFLAVTGYSRAEIAEKFQNSLRSMILREDFDRAVAQGKELLSSGGLLEVEYRLVNSRGEELWVLGKCAPPRPLEGSDYRELACILIDISGLKAEQHQLAEAAQRDALTGLYNRGVAQEKICQYLDEQGGECSGALILMDVDNFKAVNDNYGHPFADTVLTDTAAILTRSFRSSDIIGRLGGDEMLIFLKNIGDEAQAREKLAAATDALRKRLQAKTGDGELSCSFGGVICPDDGADYETLYQRADLALYAAKEQKVCTVWFSDIRLRVVDKLIAREITAIESEGGHSPLLPENMLLHIGTAADPLAEIARTLTEIGQHYGISRVYVFELNDDRRYSVNTFEWCAPGIRPELEALSCLPADDLTPYYAELFKNDGLFYCYDIRTLDPPLYNILEPQGIKSMLQCVLAHEGELFGMMGFDECRQLCYWNGRQIKILKDLSAILGKTLHAYRKMHGTRLEQLQERATRCPERGSTYADDPGR